MFNPYPDTLEALVLHEITHNEGIVATGAPHKCPDTAHTCDPENDLMDPIPSDIDMKQLDETDHSDYYYHGALRADLHRSRFVTQSLRMNLETPTGTDLVTEPFVVGGWALDLAALQTSFANQATSGVETVHVWAYPSLADGTVTGSPTFLGQARMGVNRPDVAAGWGSQFQYSGWDLSANGLVGGYWHLVAYAQSRVSGTFDNEFHRVIQIPGRDMSVDSPEAGQPCQPKEATEPFNVGGWAIDRAAASGTGIDLVDVHAYPSNVCGDVVGSPTFLGSASYGGERPDVAAVYGSRFRFSGYNLVVNRLADGYYHLVVYARSSATGLNQEGHRVVQVINPDDDLDGWSDVSEGIIGTDPLDACADNTADNAWPADINNDRFSDIFDVAALTGFFGVAVPPAPARYNIAPATPDGFVDITDISRMTGLFGQACT